MIQETLREALHKHQQGDLLGASSLYLRILEYDPNNVDALGLMSMIAETTGDHEAAIDLASKAISLKPKRVELYINLANPLLASKRIDEAIFTLEKAIKVDRRSVDVLSTLGDAYQEKGEYETAIEFYHKGLRLDRSDPILYNNLGNALNQTGDHENAIEYFQKALSIKSDYADAHYNLGTTYHTLGQMEKAVETLETAVDLNPKHHQASAKLGDIYAKNNELDKAMEAYRAALKHNPDPRENFTTLASMGDISMCKVKPDVAEDCYRTALKLKPDHPDVSGKLGFILASQNRTDEADEIFSKLVADAPQNLENHLAKALCIPILYDSVEAINTSRAQVEQYINALEGMDFDTLQFPKPGFYLSYHGRDNRSLLEAMAALVHKNIDHTDMVSPTWNAKPKIGFISSFHHEQHTIGKLNRGLIRNLSRDLFDVTVISIGKMHQYNEAGDEHPMDEYIVLSDLNPEQTLQEILDLDLDILFYTDIGMDMMTLALAHSRLARVQCVTWGHPDTTGISTIDYFVSSKLIEPENAQEHYTEELFLLDNLPLYYTAPPLIECDTVRNVLGLSKTDTFYTCPQSIFKLHPEFDRVMAEILRRDPNGRMVLLSGISEKTNQDLLRRFENNIPDVMDRVIMAPRMLRQDFLVLLSSADVMLDPIHFGGGNTTFEALAYGTPIVTMPGEFMRGRVTHGCYQKMGYTELVADTPEAYIDIAVRLGTDPQEREKAKNKILERNRVLYEDASAVRELERFFLGAIEKAKTQTTQGDGNV